MANWKLEPTDKLDMTDKDKTIAFFVGDLKHAQDYLSYLNRMKSRGFNVPTKFLIQAKLDVADSEANLKLVKSKLGIS